MDRASALFYKPSIPDSGLLNRSLELGGWHEVRFL